MVMADGMTVKCCKLTWAAMEAYATMDKRETKKMGLRKVACQDVHIYFMACTQSRHL